MCVEGSYACKHQSTYEDIILHSALLVLAFEIAVIGEPRAKSACHTSSSAVLFALVAASRK